MAWNYCGWGDGTGYGWGWFQLILLIALIAFVWWLVQSGRLRREDSETILQRRLANKDITRKEYNKLKRDLKRR